MNPLGFLAIFWLIARYLKESGDPSCERVGERMESDVEDLVSGAWGLVEGCGTALIVGMLAFAALCFVFAVLRRIGGFLGL